MSREEAVREALWARQKVWKQQQEAAAMPQAGAASVAATPTKHNTPSRSFERTPPGSQRSTATTPSPARSLGYRSKPSGSLPKKLGLGKIDDRGAGLGKKGKTAFATAYRSGEVGQWLRVDQNGSVPKLRFATAAADVPLERCLPLCFTGLSEQCHPFCLLARQGCLQLLDLHPEAPAEVPPLLPQLIPALRAALADKEADVVDAALDVVPRLARVAGAALVPFLDRLLPPLARKAAGTGPLPRKAMDALRAIEDHVAGAGPKIKAKVPAYR